VVAQSDLWFYRAYGIRVAANTGLPTIVSQLHVDEQRDPLLAAQRSRDVTTLFEAIDTETKLRLLARYDVDYIYVGAVERAFYAAAGLQKFDAMVGTYLDVAYDAPGVRIYSVVGVPPGYAQPEPFAFDTEPLLPARPVSSPHTSVTIPAESPPPDVADNAEADAPRQVLSTSTLEEQVAADPTNATLVYGLAKRYQANGRLDDAAAILAVATAANPQDVGLNHLYGDILVQAGRYEEAAEAYRRIAEAVPTAGNWNKLAVGLIEGGNLAAAEEALQQAIAIDASEAEPHFRLGQLYAMQGENEAAVASLEAYLERAPDGYLAPEARSLIENLR
jgi:Flp pilus assembly protein TadD